MWILSWKKYTLSKLATFVSVLGTLVRYGGVLCLFSGLVPAGIICFLAGIGCHFGAESISFDKWKKWVQSNGFEQRIREGDLNFAVQLYNNNPCEKSLKYFEILNPQIAAKIRQLISKK